MLADIETKVADRLNLKLAEPKRVDVDEAHTALAVPAIDVVVGGGSFDRIAQKYKITPSVYVIVTFQHLRSTSDRRKGIYPIVEAIVACLVGQNLGLTIDALVPIRMDNITNQEEAEAGKLVYQLEFRTGFIFERMTDEQIGDLLKVGLNYYLKPGDDTADASDLVSLT